jgi:hypothetical protein
MPRAVLIPGLMGTALREATLPIEKVQELCAQHWEVYPKLKRWLEERGNELCNEDSDVIWGKLQFMHWLADVKGWLDLLTRGDCYATAGGILPKGLTELELRYSKQEKPAEYKPYAALETRLRKEGVDLLTFPYDWRLRANHAASDLSAAMLERWFKGRLPDRPLHDSEKIVLIGHSLGGIIARLLVEDPIFMAVRMIKRAVLIGTPNKGAPVAFAYFTGAKSFLNDYPFWKEFRRMHDQQPKVTAPSATLETASAGGAGTPAVPNPNYYAWASREFSPQMILEDEQLELVQSLASICQLVPTYDFVELSKKKKEKLEETYKYAVHRKKQLKLSEILEEVSNVLKDARTLDGWLERHEIHYDLIGTTRLPTPTALRPHKTKKRQYVLVTKPKSGDGTVPTFSALGWAESEDGLARIEVFKTDKGKPHEIHAELCQNRQVIEHCVARTKRQPKSQIASADLGGRMGRGRIEQYMQVAHDIFRSGRKPFTTPVPDTRTQVIAFGLIEGFPEHPKPLVKTDIEKDTDGRERLKEHIPGTDKTRTVYKGTSGDLSYKFVLLPPDGEATFGSGVLFLPDDNENWLHVFGIITRRWNSKKCDNHGHAEMQLARWLEEQQPGWRRKVMRLQIFNENLTLATKQGKAGRSAREPNWGYSPCAPCCLDLTRLPWQSGNKPLQVMHWNTVYPGREGCGGETTRYSLGLMEKAGWQFPQTNPMPLAVTTPSKFIKKAKRRGVPA